MKNKRILALALVVVFLCMNTVSVFAQGFTDVKDEFWAKDYINKLVELKVVTGYPDGTYKPQDNVSKLATLVMIYKSVKAADKLGDFNEENAIKKYYYTLQQYTIPEWAKASVAYALTEEIIKLNDLMGMFNSDNSQKNATRTEVAVYVGKLLAVFTGENVEGSMVALSFKDSMFISSKDAPYIDLLAKKKILSGDEKGNFNPNEPIMRASIAKIISLSYEIVRNETIEEEKVSEISGELVHILDDDTILVQDSDENKSLYKLDNNTEIIINDKISSKDALVEEQSVKLLVREDGTVKSIVIDQMTVDLEVELSSIVSMPDYILVVVEDSNNNKKSFKASNTTDVYINDVESSLAKIEKGDKLILELDGDTIKKIKAKSKTRNYQGIMETGVFFKEGPMLTIKTNTQKVYEFEIDDDVYLKRNGKKTSITNLVKGDIVNITVEDDKVERIIATTVEKETEGVISEIILGDTNKITIETDDKEKFEYEVSSDADIEIDDKDCDFNDLKIGYEVEIEIEGDMVTDIEATKIDTSDKLDGVIIDVYSDFDAIKIKSRVNGKDITYTVNVDDAKITNTSGSSKRFSSLDEGDEVFIYGKKGQDIFDFDAKTVIIVEDNN